MMETHNSLWSFMADVSLKLIFLTRLYFYYVDILIQTKLSVYIYARLADSLLLTTPLSLFLVTLSLIALF